MNVRHRELRSLLRAADVEAARIAGRLGIWNDWQYPSAVALRAHASEYARHLSDYLRPGRIDQLASGVSHQAALCTRELAPLEPLWLRASFIVWQIQKDDAAPRRGRSSARRPAGGAALARRPGALRQLFAD